MRTIGKVFEPKKQNLKKPSKEKVMSILAEKGIEFDEESDINTLIALIPKGQTT